MTTNRRPTEQDILNAIEQAKNEIMADVADGILPWDVNCFSVLHDYVDANTYGGICDEGPIDWSYDPELGDAGLDPAYRVQAAVDTWLRKLAREIGITVHRYRPEFARGPVRYSGQAVATPTEGN